LSFPFFLSGAKCGGGVQRFRLGISQCHRVHEVFVGKIIDRNRTEIGILAVEATFRRLIGMLEPVVTDQRRPLQRRSDVMPEAGGALGLGSDQWSGTVGVWSSGISAAE
jgi:hypothetical protein